MLPAKIVKENPLKDVMESQTVTIEDSSSKAEEKSKNILNTVQKMDTTFGEEETIFQAEETQEPIDILIGTSEPDFILHENMERGEDKETLFSAETLAMPCQGFLPETNLTISDLNNPSTSEMVGNIFLSEESDFLQDLSSELGEQFFDLYIPRLPTLDVNSASCEEMQVSQDDEYLEFYAKSIALLDDRLSLLTEGQEFQSFSVETPETTTVETQVPLHYTEGSRAEEYELNSTERRSNVQPGQMPDVEGRRPPEYRLHSTERRSTVPPRQIPGQYKVGSLAQQYRLHSTERSMIVPPRQKPKRYIEESRAPEYRLHSTERRSNVQSGQMPDIEGRRPPEYRLHSTEIRSTVPPRQMPGKYKVGSLARQYRLHSTERSMIVPPRQIPKRYIEESRAPEYMLHSIEGRSIVQPEEVPMQYDEGIQAPPTERDLISGESLVTQRHVEESQSLLQPLLSTEPVPITQPGKVPVQYDGRERSQAHPTVRAAIAPRVLGTQRQVQWTPIQRHAQHSTEPISIMQKMKFSEQESIQHPAEKPAERKYPHISATGSHVPLSTLASSPKSALRKEETGDTGCSHTRESDPYIFKELLMCVHCKKCLLLAEQYKLDCIKHRGNSSHSESLAEIYPVLSLVQLLRTNYRCFFCEAKFCELHNYTCHLKCRHRLKTLTLCENCKKRFR